MYIKFIKDHPSGIKEGTVRKVPEASGVKFTTELIETRPKIKGKGTEEVLVREIYAKESSESAYNDYVDGFHKDLEESGKKHISEKLKSKSKNFKKRMEGSKPASSPEVDKDAEAKKDEKANELKELSNTHEETVALSVTAQNEFDAAQEALKDDRENKELIKTHEDAAIKLNKANDAVIESDLAFEDAKKGEDKGWLSKLFTK